MNDIIKSALFSGADNTVLTKERRKNLLLKILTYIFTTVFSGARSEKL